jgi:hypothetical protein
MKTSRLFSLVAALAVCAASHAQSPIFGHRTYAGAYTYNHADLNNDGREDLVYHTQTGFAVVLSTGPGSYAAPVNYTVPNNRTAGTVTLDMNNDGKLDVIAYNLATPNFYEYLNTGNGALQLQATYTTPAIQAMVVGDFNHDGYPDIAFTSISVVNGNAVDSLNVWFNNHAGGFTTGPATIIPEVGLLSVGDFDGDGAADVASTNGAFTYLCFGDNTGHFTVVNASTPHHPQVYLMDIDGDGKSDLVGAADVSNGIDGVTLYRALWVIYGNAARTITESEIPLNGYLSDWSYGSSPDNSPSVDVADFNGDGKRDLALLESSNSDGKGTRTLAVKLGNGDRTWNSEINLYSNSGLDFGVAAIRATDALKPDLLADVFVDNASTAQFFLNDTSGGYFGGCAFPNTATGISVCSPTTYNSTAAKFSASAAGQTAMRKMELWVDGVKKYQQLAGHDYSHYANLDTTLTLAAGTHHVTVIAARYDNLELSKSYTITVN